MYGSYVPTMDSSPYPLNGVEVSSVETIFLSHDISAFRWLLRSCSKEIIKGILTFHVIAMVIQESLLSKLLLLSMSDGITNSDWLCSIVMASHLTHDLQLVRTDCTCACSLAKRMGLKEQLERKIIAASEGGTGEHLQPAWVFQEPF